MKMIFIFLTLMMGVCQAQDHVSGGGNGGDIFVCPYSHSVLLDYYEASLRHMTISLPGSNLRDRVYSSLNRLKIIDPYRAHKLTGYAEEILEEFDGTEERHTIIKWVTDELVDINDSFEVATPTNCTKRQLVIQKSNPAPYEPRYYINVGLWLLLDEEQKALTILHEVWLRDMIESGAKDSQFARYMNELVATEFFANLKFYQYMQVLASSVQYKFHASYVSLIKLFSRFEHCGFILNPAQLNFDLNVDYPEHAYEAVFKEGQGNLFKNNCSLFHQNEYPFMTRAKSVIVSKQGEYQRMSMNATPKGAFYYGGHVLGGIKFKNGKASISKNPFAWKSLIIVTLNNEFRFQKVYVPQYQPQTINKVRWVDSRGKKHKIKNPTLIYIDDNTITAAQE